MVAALNASASATVTTAPGVQSVLDNSTAGFGAALAAAKAADQVVLYLGIDGSVEGEGKDRHFVGLPPTQVALAKAVIAECTVSKKPVVVVLINGGQLAIDWLSENAPAIIEAR
jgi:beta-glucosidase